MVASQINSHLGKRKNENFFLTKHPKYLPPQMVMFNICNFIFDIQISALIKALNENGCLIRIRLFSQFYLENWNAS